VLAPALSYHQYFHPAGTFVADLTRHLQMECRARGAPISF
jgi:hypothetical protein